MSSDLNTLTIVEARKGLDEKKFSSRDLTEACLAAITAQDSAIHAYLEVWEKEARAEADAADAMIAKGEAQPLTGIPLAIKDNILIKGRIASSGSKMLEKYVASYDATVTTKLKTQGAVFLGRTNMDEFALGSSTESSAFGTTHNPHDLTRVPGGTSGGSAAAIAAHMTLGAFGSDTGGSIRQPAAHCGIIGLKTTYGSVSRFGLMAAASSLDQVGPLAKTVADTRILFDAIRGRDENDSTTIPDYALSTTHKKRIGVPRAFVEKGVDKDVTRAFNETLEKLKASGYTIVDVDMPNLPYALPAYYVINPAEVSTNLARYDGIRYGLSVPADTIGEMYTKTRAAGFGAEVRRRILVGTFVLSSGYADAYYRKARAVRELIRADFINAHTLVDVIATPTSPNPAFKIGERVDDPVAMYTEDIFSVTANLAGVPAMSVPMGFAEREGKKLPMGMQLMAPQCGEGVLFSIGADIEKGGL